jgi:hypothetical protein
MSTVRFAALASNAYVERAELQRRPSDRTMLLVSGSDVATIDVRPGGPVLLDRAASDGGNVVASG